MGLVPLEMLPRPQPMLHDAVDEAFNALRQQVAAETGWDALSSLENAYVAPDTPHTPSITMTGCTPGEPLPSTHCCFPPAGWSSPARIFNGQTYWRVYLKARYQDGSMGMPLTADGLGYQCPLQRRSRGL